MRVLGFDPSLTNFGWALFDTNAPEGAPSRCNLHGRFQTSSKTVFVDRYVEQREKVRGLVTQYGCRRVGVESPVFGASYSEGMYGLFLYTCEALRAEHCDVVFLSPGQGKVHARAILNRPKVAGHEWKMQKADMVEATKRDTGSKRAWNHNEADAYWIARTASRFWQFHDGLITKTDLTPLELKQFSEIHTSTRGDHAGETDLKGLLFREGERFFRWSQGI
jgi:hypothetical protein